MAHPAAAALCLAFAAAGVYAIARQLSCARLPAAFGAAAWALSEALLRPGAGARAASDGAVPSLLIPFAVAGVFSREKRRWPFLALAAVCLALRWRLGNAPAGVEASELEALVVAVLAALGAQRLWDGEGGPAFLFGAAGALIASLSRSSAPTAVRLLEAAPAAAAFALVALISREARARAGLVALVALFAAQRAVEIAVGPDLRRPALTSAAGTALSPR